MKKLILAFLLVFFFINLPPALRAANYHVYKWWRADSSTRKEQCYYGIKSQQNCGLTGICAATQVISKSAANRRRLSHSAITAPCAVSE
jgi:hypothetical protein